MAAHLAEHMGLHMRGETPPTAHVLPEAGFPRHNRLDIAMYYKEVNGDAWPTLTPARVRVHWVAQPRTVVSAMELR